MLNKMEFLLQQEFDNLNHYDLMFYSELSKDLFRIFNERDALTVKKSLRYPDKVVEEVKVAAPVTEQPEVSAAPEKPMDMAAMLAAKRKATKAAGGKKKAKKATKAPAAKPAAAAAAKPAS